MWAIPKSLVEIVAGWDDLRDVSDPLLRKLTPYSLVWSIWMGRNDMVFQR